MGLRSRSSLWLALAAAALLAAAHAACTSEGPDLNPQPLPPVGAPEKSNDQEAPSGGSNASPAAPQDAAAPSDSGDEAGDGGTPTDGG